MIIVQGLNKGNYLKNYQNKVDLNGKFDTLLHLNFVNCQLPSYMLFLKVIQWHKVPPLCRLFVDRERLSLHLQVQVQSPFSVERVSYNRGMPILLHIILPSGHPMGPSLVFCLLEWLRPSVLSDYTYQWEFQSVYFMFFCWALSPCCLLLLF